MEDWQERMYKARFERLLKLIDLKAPKMVIARECLLLAGAFYNVENIIDKVTEMGKQPEHQMDAEAIRKWMIYGLQRENKPQNP